MPVIGHGWQVLAPVALFAYLLGAIPFGVVLARAFGLGDLRKIGSGSIGATNVLRTGNRFAAFLTLVLDAGKGAVAVLVARWMFGEDAAQIAALAAFLGHLFPIYLGFKGGKGVATAFGILLALSPPVALASAATWLVTAIVTRYSSFAALVSTALASFWLFVFNEGHMLFLVVAMTVLIYIRHASNIRRLSAGTEPKIGAKKA